MTLLFLGLLLVLLHFSTRTGHPTNVPAASPGSYANLPTSAVVAQENSLPNAGQRLADVR